MIGRPGSLVVRTIEIVASDVTAQDINAVLNDLPGAPISIEGRTYNIFAAGDSAAGAFMCFLLELWSECGAVTSKLLPNGGWRF